MRKRITKPPSRRGEPRPFRLPALPWWSVALLGVIVALLPYWQTLRFDFVWDDTILLVDWPYYRSPDLLGEALWRNLPFSPNYFRPLAAITFFLNSSLHGLEAAGYHATSMVLHALATAVFACLGYGLLQHLARGDRADRPPQQNQVAHSTWLALLLTLLFAWHPIHVEAVAFISGRFDLLSGLLMLLALALAMTSALHPATGNADRSGYRRWLAALGSGIAFLLALGAKEMALTLPLILLAVYQACSERHGVRDVLRRHAAVWLAMAVALLIYLAARTVSLGYLFVASANALPVGSPLQHVLLVALSTLRYVLLLVWPFGTLSPIQYGELPLSLVSLQGWVALIVLLALLAWLGWSLRQGRRAAWLWLAFAFSLLPVVNIVPLDLRGGAMLAERFLYLPSALFLIAVGMTIWPLLTGRVRWVAASAYTWQPAALGLAVLALVACLLTTLQVLPHWQDNEHLWQWASNQAPRSTLPPTNLAFVALERGDAQEALRWARLATELDPTNSTAHNNAGSALMELGRIDEAVTAFQTAADLRPDNLLYWTNLAAALGQAGQYERAITLLEDEVLARDPTSGPAYRSLGQLYVQSGQPEQALAALHKAEIYLPDPTVLRDDLIVALAAAGKGAELLAYVEEGDPLSAAQWARLGHMLSLAGDLDHALTAYDQALRTDLEAGAPLETEDRLAIQLQKANIYLQQENLEAAEAAAFQVVMSNPDDPRGHALLGDINKRRGMLAAALAAYERAESLTPGIPAITYPLGQIHASLGNTEQALAYFEQTARAAPSFAAVHVDWGELLWQQGDQDAARSHFQRYLELAPNGKYIDQVRAYLENREP